MSAPHASYEYAGFRYLIRIDALGKAIRATPLSGQHSAAAKDKHCRAAVEQYNREY